MRAVNPDSFLSSKVSVNTHLHLCLYGFIVYPLVITITAVAGPR